MKKLAITTATVGALAAAAVNGSHAKSCRPVPAGVANAASTYPPKATSMTAQQTNGAAHE